MRLRTLGLFAALLSAATTHAQQPTAPRTFDYRMTEVRCIDHRWVILAHGALLKDFGSSEANAREAHRIIQALRLTQHATVGDPPVMEYWLSNGHAPYSTDSRLRLVKLDLNELCVVPLDSAWQVGNSRNARALLFNFGKNRDNAYLALDIIRHYGFTHLGHVGPGTPAMLYFLGSPGDQDRPPTLPLAGPPVREAALGKPLPPATPQGIVQAAASAPASVPDRFRFDARRVEVKRDNNEWKLISGNYVLANFGPHQQEAQFAYNVLQYYHFTEQCLIGQPPTFAYFLANGQAPHGVKFGVNSLPFRPEALVVRRVGDCWVLCEGERPLVNFGERLQDARELVQVIQRHRFDQLCRVGSEGYGMTFLVRGR
ncbi:MAG TPA: hypothetical protein VEL76_37955 [Gemmataceae bacterium]|nr:hypothetical protein [Gemmataceae bacterium]